MITEIGRKIINQTYENFTDFNKSVFYRYDLGNNSIENEVNPIIQEIIKKLEILKAYCNIIDDYIVYQFNSSVNSIFNILSEFSNMNTAQLTQEQTYIQKNNKLKLINDNYNKLLKEIWPVIITTIIENKDILNLDFEGKSKEIEDSIDKLIKKTNDEIEQKTKTANELLTRSLKLIKDKENEVKEKLAKSAKKISLEDAQKQFDDGRKRNRNQSMIWGLLSFLCILFFILLARYFYFDIPTDEHLKSQIDLFKENFSEINRWNSIYHTVIRVMILAGVGTVATFCLKIFRANLHMYQQNLHRKRISNSIAAFVEAACSEDQSDKILELLIESVASFGHSGLIQKEDDHIYPSKMVVDNVTRSLISGK